jgi:hypothetical protein
MKEDRRNDMKTVYMLGLAAIVLGAGLLAGCVDEALDPELNFKVLEVNTNTVSPNPGGVNATDGNHYVDVKVEMKNKNDDLDLTILPESLSADDNETEVTGSYLANVSTVRGIESIRVDADTDKIFWVIFEVPDGTKLTYIRFRGTLDEPVEKEMPSY